MEKACAIAGISVHKPHNLRHSYAVNKYKKKRQEGATDIDARLEVSKDLGHNRRSVSYSYISPMIRPGRRN